MVSSQYVYSMYKLGKVYPGGKEVLKDISLSFARGKDWRARLERRG